MAWWTSDKDLTDVIVSLGVNDLIEIKFYENKVNGQSKGFAMVSTGSDQSFRILMEKLPKKQLNGQEPIVTHFSRHYFNQFEEQARKDMPPQTGNGNSHDNQYLNNNNNSNNNGHHQLNSHSNQHNNNNNNLHHGHNHNNNNNFQQQQQQMMSMLLLNSIC